MFCLGCAEDRYLSGDMCMTCPSNSEQSVNDPAECTCNTGHVTDDGIDTTTTSDCSGED